jgi:DNA replication protein DnaC
LRAIELGRQLSTAARDLKDVQHLCRCRVLMIDDLGKEKANPAMSSLLSEVFDARYGDRLPVIVTTRFSSKELRDRFAEPSIGEDICRRLFELCDGVQFNAAAQ